MTNEQQKRYEAEWANLIAAEEEASRVATQYGIGNAGVTLKDVDAAFAKMKKPLKALRKLAIEMRKKNDQPAPQ